jgi:predicted O-linked N-acetylglucosamine transferase (SPINDLY family)
VAIDYRITDACADPPGESDSLHVEKLVRLPETFLCFAPPAGSTDVAPAPVSRQGHVTFGSFNNFAKISPVTVKLWSRILASSPGCKLVIKTRGLQDPGLCAVLLGRFSEHGIDTDRITIMQPILDRREHLATYGQIDIALDSFPYNGTTTTMEALWMGVPVVTLAGDRHASRVGASILRSLGLADYVAQTEDQYVEIAARLAAVPTTLGALRQSLRSRLSQSPMTDGSRFTAHLEQAYREMWQDTLTRSALSASTRATEARVVRR